MDRLKLKQTRLIVIIAGVFVSWTTTIKAFVNFYNIEGTIFKIKDCLIPNPITTPCFWGAVAFLIAAFWSYKLYKNIVSKGEKYFLYFMIGAVIFAWSNFVIELNGVEPVPGALIAPCPATSSSPFLSPCFFGSILFTLAVFLTLSIINKKK